MSYQLTIEPTGDEVEVEEGQNMLDACLRAGVWMPHACCHGLCGTCKVEVLEGDVDVGDASSFALMDMERDEGKVLACCATLESDTVIEADIDEDPDARTIPVRDFEAEIVRLENLTHDVKGVWLKLDGDGIDFQAGQYINFHVPGVEVPRAFSLANKPSDPQLIELHIRLVPDGEATPIIHNDLKPGDRVNITGPYGRFFVRKSRTEPMVFIAGGTGLSSPKSMILDLLETGCTTPITLLHGVRAKKISTMTIHSDPWLKSIAISPTFLCFPRWMTTMSGAERQVLFMKRLCAISIASSPVIQPTYVVRQ